MIYKAGTDYKCIEAKSQWYKVGSIYRCHKDHNGTHFFGEDGVKDYTSLMLSKFREDKRATITIVKE